MTSQTKQFIDISDLLAFRLECNHCGANLIVSLRKSHGLPLTCVNCQGDWFSDPDSLARSAIGEFARMVTKLNGLLDKQGVKFSIEITPEKTTSTKATL